MCSIMGYFNPRIGEDRVKDLNNSMLHRGPDNSSVFKYKFRSKIQDLNIFLGHNRLAIQDLDSKANQPMENEKFIIVFNGEIYNHFEIRKELNFNFHTSSDTETLLLAFTQLGIEQTINKLNGMFAIALFDKIENKLFLIRDRVGIKPLYFSFQNNEFIFSSELKAFPEHLKSKVRDESLISFVSLGYIPKDNTYFENVQQLLPANYLVFDGENFKTYRYWQLPEVNKNLNLTFDEVVEKTEELITSSINYRLLSDLEVGSFLSGGVDSSLVSAIASKISKQKLKTFSIGFENPKYDESIFAREVAKNINSDHFEYIFTAKDVLNLIDKFPKIFDEPFGDASALPTLILSQFTKKNVTVSLSGDGGDELFLGYDRYFFTQNYYSKFSKIPPILRKMIAQAFKFSKIDKFEKISFPIENLTPINLYSVISTAVKPWDLEKVFSKEFLNENFKNSEKIDFLQLQDVSKEFGNSKNLIDNLSRLDFFRYLPNDILTKVDRTSMNVSLEARVPLLDYRLIEFAYSLPTSLKLQKGRKSILREILYKYVPENIVNRPKQGFAVPLKHWFRNELKEQLRQKIESLDERFNKKELRKLFYLHTRKNRNYEYLFWNLMQIK